MSMLILCNANLAESIYLKFPGISQAHCSFSIAGAVHSREFQSSLSVSSSGCESIGGVYG